MNKPEPFRLKRELALLGALLLAAGISYVLLNGKDAGGTAVVKLGQSVIREVPLAVDGSYSVTGADGSWLLTCVVKDGGIRVSESSCPDHLCVDMGTVSHAGETIVCLPNQVVITVRGGSSDPAGLDGVVR